MSDMISIDNSAGELLRALNDKHLGDDAVADDDIGDPVLVGVEDDTLAIDTESEEVDESSQEEAEDDASDEPEQIDGDIETIELDGQHYEIPQSLVEHIKSQVPGGKLTDDDKKRIENAGQIAEQYATRLEQISMVTPEPQQPNWVDFSKRIDAGELNANDFVRAQAEYTQKKQAFDQMQQELVNARQTAYQERLQARDAALVDPAVGIKGWDDGKTRDAEVKRDLAFAGKFGLSKELVTSITEPGFFRLLNYAASLEGRANSKTKTSQVRAISPRGAKQNVVSAQRKRDRQGQFSKAAANGATDLDALLKSSGLL